LLDRLDEPDKRWKFSMTDIADRKLWPKYMAAYEDMIRARYVVPADHKWFARFAVARAMIETLDRLDLGFPKIQGAALKELQKVRSALIAEGRRRADAGKRRRRR
jgi:hypothetical protein